MSHNIAATDAEPASGGDRVLEGGHDHVHVDHIHPIVFSDAPARFAQHSKRPALVDEHSCLVFPLEVHNFG